MISLERLLEIIAMRRARKMIEAACEEEPPVDVQQGA